MGRCHQIDVVASLFLQMEHHPSQLFIGYLPAPPSMGDSPVLAKDTAEVAVREKDGPRTASAHQRRLLAEMGVITGNHPLGRPTANSLFTLQAVYPTPMGTEDTILQQSVCFL